MKKFRYIVVGTFIHLDANKYFSQRNTQQQPAKIWKLMLILPSIYNVDESTDCSMNRVADGREHIKTPLFMRRAILIYKNKYIVWRWAGSSVSLRTGEWIAFSWALAEPPNQPTSHKDEYLLHIFYEHLVSNKH